MNWLPEGLSTYAGDIDAIFWVIMVVTGIILVGVEVTLLYFVVRYRGREGRKAEYIEGNTKAEVIWTVIPTILILGLAFGSQTVWSDIRNPEKFPEDALELKVQAKQFEWNITYPGIDDVLGTDDDFTRRNALHVPAGRPVIIELGADDVIHSFFVPEFRLKQDAVPGLEDNRIWFEATEPGEFELACAELCGLGHYRMKGRVIVYTPEEYARWLQEQG